jgi:hypothetical protein
VNHGEGDGFIKLIRRSSIEAESWGKDRLASLLPLGLLALACLGFDRARQDPSFRMDVHSDYLPEHLLDAAWYGEFPI